MQAGDGREALGGSPDLATLATAYFEGAPLVSDQEYDALVDAETLAGGDDPVGGGYVPVNRKVVHDQAMLSLDKVHSREQLGAWLARLPSDTPIVVEPKFDGLAVTLTYLQGKLVLAATRGDGFVGENVTGTVSQITNLPIVSGSATVRGEVVLDRQVLVELLAAGDSYANPRNAAAGIIRREDEAGLGLASRLRFEPHDPDHPPSGIYRADDLDGIMSVILRMERERLDLLCDIDGAVVKVSGAAARQALGETRHHPRWAIAYKFGAEVRDTVLEDVRWSMGRTGRLIPLAFFRPVHVGGVVIRTATLHNVAMLELLELGPGDTIQIKRSGDVIPYVMGRLQHGGGDRFVSPDGCPFCGAVVERTSRDLYCRNPVCDTGRLSTKILYALQCLGVDGVGPAGVDAVIHAQLVSGPTLASALGQLMDLAAEQLVGLPRYGEVSAIRFVRAVAMMRDASWGAWISALGIPGVGPTVSRDVILATGSPTALLAAIHSNDLQLAGLGPARHAALRGAATDIIELVAMVTSRGITPWIPEVSSAPPPPSRWGGAQVVITGTVEGATRTELADWLTARGATVQGGVNGKTTHLVAGDKAGSKLRKAQEMDIPVVPGAELLAEIRTDEG